MNVLGFLTGIFKPAADLVDALHTSDEEKAQVKAAVLGAQIEAGVRLLEQEAKLVEQQSAVIRAEATSDSWLTRSWRPIVMLTFASILVYSWLFGMPATLPEYALEKLFDIIHLGLGGYIVGRSGEKLLPQLVSALKPKP